jgi:hypothetical protein
MEKDPILAELESLNSGKGVRIAREADLADSVACLRYYAGLADKPNGSSVLDKKVQGFYELIFIALPGGMIRRSIDWCVWKGKVHLHHARAYRSLRSNVGRAKENMVGISILQADGLC